MSLSGELIAFIGLALVAIVGGVLLITLTKVVHMVIALVFTFLGIAGIYMLLSAEFVAIVQILIYSGAITIVMLFGIMLTKHQENDAPAKGGWGNFSLLAAIAGFAVAVYLGIYNLDIPVQPTALHEENTKQIGIELFSKYVIPFEVMSVLLLVALVGAIVLAKKDDEEGDRS
ncbi:NADH-quinone oxidoreductase subunit J [Peribacillus castrilensis]|jgi:NADH-quinone oxidoreductase subunit J|uniref:NADH-quinone oxidoreductase subunit J n=4 Tax=Peribacillus TaxID=2675229 RepID=A0A098F7A2_9BACI|nr:MULTISPECIES: NADH-quinone oxidoreductase subunit J [Bacillaceae]KOR81091.1 NADH:ubiquinone oxidoreductase subunit J [Bacillus sp. FJAT-21352]KRF50848.1 NADH:ubiquinone oxidoreductase subunit J [Bacillus sp. Soil745]MCD1160615.1 NADH-quinone oxidoreductase subunit J [Peribacillus castrilensis]MCP1092794.1 NADH-quinone oxidoreductase subunit J [Bacillaceae bacterium OS4b]MDP9738376.1 NADH-quinone oxidoreductase subunit J [Bacillus sp. B2I3]PEF37568.1 NADH:ubiquinone oxidoreductase subunit J